MDAGSQPDLPLTPSPAAPRTPRPSRPAQLPALTKPSAFENFLRMVGLDPDRNKPLRLLTTPDDMLWANPVSGKAIRAGHFRFRGITLDHERLGRARMPLPPDFHAYIDSFAWVRDLAAAAPLPEVRPLAEGITHRWLQTRAGDKRRPAWRGDVVGWRILNMIAGAPLLLASEDGKYRARLLDHLAECEAYIAKGEGDRPAKGREQIAANAGALAAALLLSRSRRPVGWHEKRMDRAIRLGIYDDGGIASRSPLSLFSTAEALALLADCYRARQVEMPKFLDDVQRRVLGALRALVHGDGGTASWMGAVPIASEKLDALIAASRVVPRAQADVRHWGYQRLTAGHSVMLMDAAPPPGEGQSEAGCASTLAIEFSYGPERIFISCGGGALVGANVSADLARGLRSTAAHSTLCLDDVNSTSVLANGRLGVGVDMVDCDARATEQGVRIEASHDGYEKNFGFTHRRAVVLGDQGRKIRGLDTLLPTKNAKKGTAYPFAIRFHLHPDIEVEMRPDGQSALLRLASGSLWHFHATDGLLSIEDSLMVDEKGRPQNSWQLVISGETGAGGISSSWLLNHIN